jgi:putative ABC transport system permease protein
MKLYLKIAIRNAFRNGTLSFAKLFGLSISFAVILFASGYVYYETSFEKCIPDYNRIYRCLMDGKVNNREESFAVTSPEEARVISSEIPEITEAIRIMYQGEATFKYDNESYQGGPFFLADPEFFSFFGIDVNANVADPLASQHNLVIARSLAETHFGSVEKAMDKVVEIRGEDCTITGVFDDLPKNFHLQPKLIESLQKSNPDSIGWNSQSYYTYFKTINNQINLDELNFKISKTVYTHYDSDGKIDATNAKTWEDLKYAPELYVFYTAEPLTQIHFSKHKFDPAMTSNKLYVYGAVVLAILILTISSINFINLTFANISTRLKEVGIRKTTGAKNQNIVRQFLFESLIFLIVGFTLAVFIYRLCEMPLTQYLRFDIALSNKGLLKIMALTFASLLIFNLTAVLFPIVLIANRRIQNLIKEEKSVKGRFSVNNYFVFLQFILSGFIILSSIIVQKQINFMVNKDRGYDSQNILMLVMWEMNPETRKSFIEELKTYNAIKSISTSDVYFGEDFGMNGAFFETEEDKNYFHTSVLPVDDEFLNTFNLKMKEGRFFEKAKQTDFNAAILNETALKQYSGEGSMIDKDVIVGGKTYYVIGIVKDFNFRSLHNPIQPLVITRIENFGNVSVKITNDKIPEAIEILQKLWKKYNIPFPLSYEFHDAVVAAHYIKDQQAKRLLLILSIISIAIACVGLYAISFFTIVRRTKEIGIRKVNGALVTEVITMLNRDFIKWVAIAFFIVCPVAWFTMHRWLQNFAYKTTLSWWVFAAAGGIIIMIALLTVSIQSYKAATRNPVEALRYE